MLGGETAREESLAACLLSSCGNAQRNGPTAYPIVDTADQDRLETGPVRL